MKKIFSLVLLFQFILPTNMVGQRAPHCMDFPDRDFLPPLPVPASLTSVSIRSCGVTSTRGEDGNDYLVMRRQISSLARLKCLSDKLESAGDYTFATALSFMQCGVLAEFDHTSEFASCYNWTASLAYRVKDSASLVQIIFGLLPAFPDKKHGAYVIRFFDLLVPSAEKAQDEYLAASIYFNKAACLWSSNEFELAYPFFERYSQYLSRYLITDPDTNEEDLVKLGNFFQTTARRYIRYMVDLHLSRSPHCTGGRCLEAAWQVKEKLQSRLINSYLLRSLLIKHPSAAAPAEQYASLLRAREMRKFTLTESPATNNAAALDDQIKRAEEVLRTAAGEDVAYLESQSISMAELSHLLKPGELYLSYSYSDDWAKPHGWIVQNEEQPRVERLKIQSSELGAIAGQIRQQILAGKSLAEIQSGLTYLSSILLAPLNISAVSHIILAVDEDLAGFPFELLSKGEKCLCQLQVDVSYVPSATLFAVLRKRKKQTGYRYDYAGFGRGKYAEPDLPSLEFVATEINKSASLYHGNVITASPEASEADVYRLRNKLADTRIIHFAAHSSAVAGRIAIRLHEGDGQDANVTSNDIIANLNNHAEVVVLSACSTARDEHIAADESFSTLASAFLATGAQHLLVSQWSVYDKPSAEFVPLFLQKKQEGLTNAEALRQTRVEIRGMFAQPKYWAAFILLGD
jgi:CHAT domain-containing protein